MCWYSDLSHMVNVCCAPGCTNKSSRDTSVSYHRFPANKKLQRKWLRSLRRETLEVNKNTRVCSAHFKDGKISSRTDVPYVRSPSLVPQLMQPRKPVTRLCGNGDNTILIALRMRSLGTKVHIVRIKMMILKNQWQMIMLIKSPTWTKICILYTLTLKIMMMMNTCQSQCNR